MTDHVGLKGVTLLTFRITGRLDLEGHPGERGLLARPDCGTQTGAAIPSPARIDTASQCMTRYAASMDVHPPHSPIHTWQDFLVHLFTITVGLLIALALEAGAESIHHRQLVAEARENLRREIAANHKICADNVTEIKGARDLLAKDIDQLRDLRAGRAPQQLDLHWKFSWNGYSNAAWNTARDSGAVPYMPLDTIEGYSGLYMQQAYVNEAGLSILLDETKAGAPLRIARDRKDPKEFAPVDVQTMLTASAEIDARLETLQSLMKSLDDDYVEALKGQ